MINDRQDKPTDQLIRELAAQFRTAIDMAKEDGELNSDFMFDKFPRGCCRDASTLLGQYLLDNVIESYYVCGIRYFDDPEEQTQSHGWLLVEDLIVDITGDQFSDRASYYNYSEAVYVGTGNSFYDLFEVEDRNIHILPGIEEYGGLCKPRFFDLYAKVKKYLYVFVA